MGIYKLSARSSSQDEAVLRMKDLKDPTALEVMDAIRKHPYTLVVVAEDRRIVSAIPFQVVPDAKGMNELSKSYRSYGAQFFPKGEVSQQELEQAIDRLVYGLRLIRQGKLKPGANLIDKEGNLEWAKDAARRRLLKQKKRGVR